MLWAAGGFLAAGMWGCLLKTHAHCIRESIGGMTACWGLLVRSRACLLGGCLLGGGMGLLASALLLPAAQATQRRRLSPPPPLLPPSTHPPTHPPTLPLAAAVETYHLLSQRWFTHASPTLFNAGTPRPQLSSCFLVCMKNDSIEGGWKEGGGWVAGLGRP